MFKDKINRAKERFEESTEKVAEIEKELNTVTEVLKDVGMKSAAIGLGSSEIMKASKRKEQLKLAEEALSWRKPNMMPNHSKLANVDEKVNSKDSSHLPSHVRAAYEQDIDKISHSMRVGRNVSNETNYSRWMSR